MTFLIVVLMSTLNIGDVPKAYIFIEPDFANFEQCKVFVQTYHNELYKQAIEKYNYKYPPKEIYCADKDSVIKMMKESQGIKI